MQSLLALQKLLLLLPLEKLLQQLPLQINCPSMSFGVNIVSLGRKLMIGKRQKCAEPPGGGGILGVVHNTSTERGGGADFWVCAQ